jgi:ACT domain-containing protein
MYIIITDIKPKNMENHYKVDENMAIFKTSGIFPSKNEVVVIRTKYPYKYNCSVKLESESVTNQL